MIFIIKTQLKFKNMKKVIRLTESDLVKIVKRVINESQLINEGVPTSVFNEKYKYRLTSDGTGWLKSNETEVMCVKVESGFPFGTFAQGIKSLVKTADGGFEIVPTQSKIRNIIITKDQFYRLVISL
jgi:hypothetical protein